MGNTVAKPGHIFVCCACGKVSPDRYGLDTLLPGEFRSPGWDESCMLNAAEFRVDDLVWNKDRSRVTSTTKLSPGEATVELGRLWQSWHQKGLGVQSAAAVTVVLLAKLANRAGVHVDRLTEDLRMCMTSGESPGHAAALGDLQLEVEFPPPEPTNKKD